MNGASSNFELADLSQRVQELAGIDNTGQAMAQFANSTTATGQMLTGKLMYLQFLSHVDPLGCVPTPLVAGPWPSVAVHADGT